MKHARLYFVILAVIAVAGCASSSYLHYEPSKYEIHSSKRFSVEFGQFWDLYVEELSKSFFVINNIEKESRIINVSFSVNQPSEYVDCGRSERISNHPATGKQHFNYLSVDDSTYQAGVDNTNFLWTIKRDTALDGRANIFMAPDGPETLLRVNVRYVWSVDVSGISNVGHTSRDTHRLSFSTSETGSLGSGEDKLVCVSNGKLEARLLNLVSE